MATVLEIAGWMGAAALLGAYGLVSTGRFESGGRSYQLFNLLGSAGLTVNAVYHQAWPLVALNTTWLLIATFALRRGRLGEGRQHRG